jgi:hypothetical protein
MLLAFGLWAQLEVVVAVVVVDSFHYRKFLIHLGKFYNPQDMDSVGAEVRAHHNMGYQQ